MSDTTNAKTEYKVQRVLWESLEAVLLAQSKKYITEIASRLELPEKELIRRVLPSSDCLKIYIQDSNDTDNQCKAYIQDDEITGYCRKPVVYGTEFCHFHRTKRMTVIKELNPLLLRKIKDRKDCDNMWVDEKNTLYNSKGTIVGKLNNNDGKIQLFVIKS
jgi:hypothetical protein